MTQQPNTNNSRRFQVRQKRDYVERSRLETFIPHSLEEMQAAYMARQARYAIAAEAARQEAIRKSLPPPPPPLAPLPAWTEPPPPSPLLPIPPRVEVIQTAVCAHFGLGRLDMLSSRRAAYMVLPRHLAIYLCRVLTYRSLNELGLMFRRDHSTVVHAIAHIKHQLQHDPQLEASVMMLTERLGP